MSHPEAASSCWERSPRAHLYHSQSHGHSCNPCLAEAAASSCPHTGLTAWLDPVLHSGFTWEHLNTQNPPEQSSHYSSGNACKMLLFSSPTTNPVVRSREGKRRPLSTPGGGVSTSLHLRQAEVGRRAPICPVSTGRGMGWNKDLFQSPGLFQLPGNRKRSGWRTVTLTHPA